MIDDTENHFLIDSHTGREESVLKGFCQKYIKILSKGIYSYYSLKINY